MGYWDSFNSAANATNAILLEPQQEEAMRQQNALRQLAIQDQGLDSKEKVRQLAAAAGARAAATNAQPIPATTVTTQNGGYTPAPPVDSSANLRALLGTPADAAQRNISDAQATAAQYPGMAQLSGLNDRITQMKADASSAPMFDADPNAKPFNPVEDQMAQKAAQDAQPTTETVTTPGTPANPLKAQIEYYNSIGETQKAQALSDSLIDHANKVMALTGNPNDALQIVNHATGEKLAYSPLASLDAITNDGQLVGYIDKNKYKELMTGGASPMVAMKGAMIPLDLGGGGKAVMEYMATHPDATVEDLARVGAEAGVPLSKMIPVLNEKIKAAGQAAADKRQEKAFQHSEEMQRNQFAHSDAQQTRTLSAIAARSGAAHPTNGGLSDQAVEDAAVMYNLTGTLPSGRNKEANAAIQNKAADLRKASGQTAAGVVANAGDMKALQETIKGQEKMVGSMGSFVKNIDKQVGRFEDISKQLNSYDSRLLNVPLRALRGRVAGSPLQSKIDMYLTEISSETGKLASGSTGSVAELSQGARDKWEKIHDPNLSMADLLDVLKETRHAGAMRMDSVNEQLAETRRKRGSISGSAPPQQPVKTYKDPGHNTMPLSTDRPVRNAQGQVAYRQPDGSVRDAQGRRLN